MTAGQAGAIRTGLSKALACHSDVPIQELVANQLLITDSRRVERKKPGQMKARRKFSWSVVFRVTIFRMNIHTFNPLVCQN